MTTLHDLPQFNCAQSRLNQALLNETPICVPVCRMQGSTATRLHESFLVTQFDGEHARYVAVDSSGTEVYLDDMRKPDLWFVYPVSQDIRATQESQ